MDKEIEMKELFRSSTPELPTNFSFIVMQRVYTEAIRQARQQARLQSWLVGGLSIVLGVLVLIGYSLYADGLNWQISVTEHALFTPVLVTILAIGLFDLGLSFLRR